ncbi:MAG: fatty acid--CoA ligase [Proteobacteria bacterium]|nr:fatty acid--CoA ligase [Pseudomonadota bacterium]
MTRDEAIAATTGPGGPYELMDAVIAGRALRVFKHAPASMRALYEQTATDQPFLSYGDERWTFAQAWQAAARIGHVLVHDCGVRHGERVAIAMRNYPEWVLAFTAITAIGAVAVGLNAHWQADELAYALADCDARVVFADSERLQRLAECAAEPGLAGLQVLSVRTDSPMAGARPLAALTDAVGDVPMPPVDIAADDLAIMMYTSGSTGHPKGVPSTHRNVLSALLSWEADRRVGELVAGIEPLPPAVQPGTLLAVPLFHVTALHASYMASYRLQRRVVCMYRWDAEAAAALIEREQLSSVVAPAAVTGDLVRVAQQGKHDLSCLLAVGGGGAPRAPEQVRQIATSFGNALPNIGWGMTETNAIGAGNSGEDYLRKPASSGRCSLVLQLKVVDEASTELPPGQRGELLVRGTSVFGGYWKRPEANAQAFTDGDWFRTGDVACIDDEGFIFIVDRLKDLIIRGGENIGCGHVEAALLLHPLVREAAVYAVPDERLGEEVGATIYASEALDLDELRRFLATHLARFELPRHLLRADQPLPRTPSGKIFKRQIRETALAEIGRGAA